MPDPASSPSPSTAASALHQVLYVSTAVRPFSDEDLDYLLETARNLNKAGGITGLLLYAGRHFIQALEGPEGAVRATMARIEADSRHRELVVMVDRPVNKRDFDKWLMGFERIEQPDSKRLRDFLDLRADRDTLNRLLPRERGVKSMLRLFFDLSEARCSSSEAFAHKPKASR